MSLSNLLSFKKKDNQKPAVPVSPIPQHNPPTARTSAPLGSSITVQDPAQLAGNRRASGPNTFMRPVDQLTQPGIEPFQGGRSISSSNHPLKTPFYSGFFCDSDESERNGPSLFTQDSPRQPVIRRPTSNSHKASFFTRLSSRVKPFDNFTARLRRKKADHGWTQDPHIYFRPEESPSLSLPSVEGTVSSQPSHFTSVTNDPALCGRFSLHGRGTLLLPQAPQLGLKHRNRNTALISPSKSTIERNSRSPGESEWQGLSGAEKDMGEVKRKARLAAWTALMSGAAPPAVPGDELALSILKRGSTNDRPLDLRESSSLALSRTESISTASLTIDLDVIPSVAPYFRGPFTPLTDRSSASVWEATQLGAMRSSTDLVHGSWEATNALADLIDVLGLDQSDVEGQRLSRKAPGEGKSALKVPPRRLRKGTLLNSERPIIPPIEPLLPPSPTTARRVTLPAPRPSTLNPSASLAKPTLFSLRKGSNLSFLDIEVKDSSAFVTPAPKSAPLHTHWSHVNQVSERSNPQDTRRSFLPDMSGSNQQTETRPKKTKRPSTAPQPSRPYMDDLRPEKRGKRQSGNVFPKFLSPRPTETPPPLPPVSSSRSRLLSWSSVARISHVSPSPPKASRFDHRTSRMNGSDSGFGSSFSPLPITP